MRAMLMKVASLAILSALISISLLAPKGWAQQTKSSEMQLRVLEDREEIRQLLVDYGRTLDQRDFKAFSKLFSENAEYVSGGSEAIKGSAAIARFLEEVFRKNPTGVRSPNFHLFTNEIIHVNGDEAVAISKGLFVIPNQANVPEIAMLATYNDVLVRDQNKWKFKRRVVTGDIPAPNPKK
jgi:uncharacterized protein (TIGR02246 family)